MKSAIPARALSIAAAFMALAAFQPLGAQRPVVHGNDVWITLTGEQRVAPRAVVSSTIDIRRSNGLGVPRQLLGNLALMGDIGRGMRLGFGYGHAHTTPNEDFGPSGVTSEHRVFEQLTGSHHTLGMTWSHRLRYEQRWIAPEPADGAKHDWSYTSRVRHQLRLTIPLDGQTSSKARLYAVPNSELFVTTTDHHGVFFAQSRLGVAVGAKALARLNVEAGYLRQSQIRGDGVHELHHVLQFTGRVPLGH